MPKYNSVMKADNTVARVARIHEMANQVIVTELAKRGHEGLAPSHGDVLGLLLFKGEMTKTDIASQVHRERSTTTTLLKKLERLGYIKTRVNDNDARSALVSLTDKGLNMKQDFIEISEKLYEIQYKDMSLSQIDAFRQGIEQMYKNFKSL